MSKRICISNQKGGVGKSTTTVQLAFHLLALGMKVLVVDMDPQGNSTLTLARDKDGERLPLTGTRVTELFQEGLEHIEVMHCPRGVDLIHTPAYDLEMYELEAISLDASRLPVNNCRRLFAQYDYVLIDCPPTLGRLLIAGLNMGTHVVCPVEVASFSVEGIIGLVNTIEMVTSELNPSLEIVGVFINKFDANSKEQHRERERLSQALGENLLNHVMPDRTPIDTAISRGIPVSELGYAHVAARELKALYDEILEKVNS
ncbi:chromosome partitioning protein [Modicisalibacter xianhensis]|uniref:Chromosome partitioning protein n=1 Tax=Modicisalibacter xianhensis TaxID=442341 RepID=A0A4R8FF95_9GAMM|nr:ParA family protein [Halomonas xianhensis]TDX22215.1 chromosome partitioning protein [Halomonas xianhensis]